ncbi:hypothetical protein ACU686_13855 [Yinghuangia aomiensis]
MASPDSGTTNARAGTASGLLEGRKALITGGDSGIGRGGGGLMARRRGRGHRLPRKQDGEVDDARHTVSLATETGQLCLDYRTDRALAEDNCVACAGPRRRGLGGLDIPVMASSVSSDSTCR